MAGFQDWLKKNTAGNAKWMYGGSVGLGFLGLDVAAIAASDNKLKALLKTMAQLVFLRPLIAVGLAGAFSAMSKSVRALVTDTGSLEAYLKKLTQIQGFQRIFAPLVGGAEAAKRKVAELVNLAAKSPFAFGDWGETTRGLQIFTRGAFASASALKLVGDAAAATGNGIVQTGDAVGEFYATLRSGEPIAGVVEKMRQMGLINEMTAGTLVSLQDSGAGAARVFDELTGALAQHAGGMESLKGDVASVQAEYEKAAETIKESFASPFAADDVENTKNMTAAMVAIQPAVESLAGWLAKLTNGFSTTKTWLMKVAAESPMLTSAVEGTIEALTALVAVVSVVAGIGLGAWLMSVAGFATQAAAAISLFVGASGAAATAITALGVAVRVAAIATGVGAIVVALGTAVGIIYNFVRAADGQRKAVDDLRKAHQQADETLKRQIASVTTLQERHEALTKALEEQTTAQLELNKAIAEHKSTGEVSELQKRVLNAMQNVRGAAAVPSEGLAPSAEEQKRIEMEADRNRALSEQAFTNEFQSATPARQREMLVARQADLQARAQAAAAGVNAAASASREKADAMLEVAKAEQAFRGRGPSATGVATQQLMDAWQREAGVGLDAPRDSSLYAQTQAQRLMAARRLQAGGLNAHEQDRLSAIAGNVTKSLKPGEEIEPAIANWLRYAAQRKHDEGNVAQLAGQGSEVAGQIATLDREEKLAEERAKLEREIGELKSHGVEYAEQEYRLRQKLLDKEIEAENAKKSPNQARLDELQAQKAANDRQLTERHRSEEVEKASIARELAGARARRLGTEGGDTESVDLANLDAAAKRFENLRQLFPDNEAKAKALELTSSEIQDRAGGAIASSLARIGGGGGVYDPAVDIQRQIKDLTEKLVEYVGNIDGAVSGDDRSSKEPDTTRPE